MHSLTRILIMNQHQFAPAVFVACVLMAFAGSAAAGIVKCVDNTGAVTFTDVPCNTDPDAAHAADAIQAAPAPAGIKPSLRTGNFAAAEEARVAAWANKPAANRSLARDVATLKAAKAAMISSDSAAALVRQQALAQL
jgi:O-succinylbenzoate synthase